MRVRSPARRSRWSGLCTYHDYHESFNAPPDSGGLVLFSQPVESSGDRGILLGLALSLTVTRFSHISQSCKAVEDAHHGIVAERMTDIVSRVQG